MTPDDVAKILVKNADNGDYLFKTESEFLDSCQAENGKYVKSYFINGTLFSALSKLGWTIEPYKFKDHEGNNVNYSNDTTSKLAKTGGKPSGYRLTKLPNV